MMHKHKPLFFVLMPQSKPKVFWNMVIIALLLYTASIVPYRTAFVDDTTLGWYIFELFVDTLFLFDLFVNFISAYEIEHNMIEV